MLHIYNFEVLVGKFYHEHANQNFLKYFKYKGETVLEKQYRHITKEKVVCINLLYLYFIYIYILKLDWWFYEMLEYDIYLLEKYSKTMGFSVHGFNFVFSVDEVLKKTIMPSPESIDSTGGFEEVSIILEEIFKVPQEKLVKTAIDS